MKLFFQELNEFIKSKPIQFHHLVVSPKKALKYLPNAPYPSRLSPDKLVLVTFEKPAGTNAYYFKKNKLIHDCQFPNYDKAISFAARQFADIDKEQFKVVNRNTRSVWRPIENFIYDPFHRPDCP